MLTLDVSNVKRQHTYPCHCQVLPPRPGCSPKNPGHVLSPIKYGDDPQIGEDFADWTSPGGDDRALRVADFCIFPYLGHELMSGDILADRWAADIAGPAYARRSRRYGRLASCRQRRHVTHAASNSLRSMPARIRETYEHVAVRVLVC
jgi:hypothetical protein